ncbi:MAG: hypothetical protein AAFQ99_02660, partial [Pseudomonadota bacterium]
MTLVSNDTLGDRQSRTTHRKRLFVLAIPRAIIISVVFLSHAVAGEFTEAQFEDELIRLLSDARAYFFVLYTEDTQERLVSSGMDQREARASSAAIFGRAHYCFAEDIMVGIGPIREAQAVSAYFAERRSRISSLDTIYGRCIEGAMKRESERRSIDYAPEIRPAICGRLSILAADIAAQLEAEIPAWRIRASSLVRSREIS